jgi:hypothetical protein
MASNNASTTDASVSPVLMDGRPIGHVFGVSGRFFFLLSDDRDPKPRGSYESDADAAMAAEHQFRCMEIADRWELMIDT